MAELTAVNKPINIPVQQLLVRTVKSSKRAVRKETSN